MNKPSPLSPYEIEGARRKVLTNALGMLEEAEILFKYKRYARAYALAHLAGEEFAKLAIFYRAGLDAMRGFAVEWRALQRRLLDHRAKLRLLALVDRYIALMDPAEDANGNAMKQRLEMVEQWNELKNLSLYVSWQNNQFVAPSEVVGENEARRMLEQTKLRAGFFAQAELGVETDLDSLANNLEIFTLFDNYLEMNIDPQFGRKHGESDDPIANIRANVKNKRRKNKHSKPK